MLKVSVIGLGAWGSALALTAYRAGSHVTMIGLEHEVNHAHTHRNVKAFPDVKLPDAVTIDSSYDSLSVSDLVVFVVPAQSLRSCLRTIKCVINSDTPCVIASKGIEQSTGLLMGEVAAQEISNPIAILSGPNFASEIIRNHPAATTIGCKNKEKGQMVVQAFAHRNFRPYLNSDVIGVQIGGAVKNVLAIACGIVRARGFGENAVASLITRGLHEIKMLGLAKGAREETFLGLSGVGDVVLTCMGTQSRNFQFGFEMGQRQNVDRHFLSTTTVEGFYTTEALQTLIKLLKVEMPLCTMVYDVLYKNVHIDVAIESLLSRPLKEEGI
ncbi:MAG: NAD(P)H-dependent glycerol-3-phosphate dehydrogenase [Alphaproteobacteria bacterium]